MYLLFSVNRSGHFCGVAQMMSNVDFTKESGLWATDRWKGEFEVRWIFVKDVPNELFRHIRLKDNENKAVTHSRDTQEVPLAQGRQVLQIIARHHAKTSIFDDFHHYEELEAERQAGKAIEGMG